VVDRTELEDARWFDRAELALMHKRQHPDGLFAAHPFAIAHHLIGQWLHGGTAGGA
jgi:NAD+ diphosphatase